MDIQTPLILDSSKRSEASEHNEVIFKWLVEVVLKKLPENPWYNLNDQKQRLIWELCKKDGSSSFYQESI